MALERDLELLDDYLANRLSDGDKSAVESKIASDPELKRELSIQRQVIEGLRRARLAELKQMLNNTPVPPIAGQALLAKLGAAAAVAGIVGAGLYFFLKDDTTATEQHSGPVAPTHEETISAPQNEQTAAQTPPAETPAATPAPIAPSAKAPAAKGLAKTADTSVQSAQKPQKPAAFEPAEEESNVTTSGTDVPVISGAARSSHGSSSISIENVEDKKYNFHYQFKAGKLLLYGPFSEKTTYEILEFFADNNKRTTVVLFYKTDYYLLREENDKITPLKPITDPALLNKLKEYRKN